MSGPLDADRTPAVRRDVLLDGKAPEGFAEADARLQRTRPAAGEWGPRHSTAESLPSYVPSDGM